MDRRTEARVEISLPARVRVLSSTAPSFDAWVVNLSGRGMCLQTAAAIPVSEPLQIDLEDELYLGEACYCGGNPGQFRSGIRIEHALGNLAGLRQLAEALQARDSRVAASTIPAPQPKGL
jgi:hypothetical protein